MELPLAYAGMLVSIGLRQIPRFRRAPRDLRRLPLFVLQVTFVMVPVRIAAFATMFNQGWITRSGPPVHVALRSSMRRPELPPEPAMAVHGEPGA
jgi:hypothetical protein